jgi:hypothetical protein
MMGITLDINDTVIAEIGVHRVYPPGRGSDNLATYHIYDTSNNPRSLAGAERIATVQHDPDDGAIELGRIVLDEIDESVTD